MTSLNDIMLLGKCHAMKMHSIVVIKFSGFVESISTIHFTEHSS